MKICILESSYENSNSPMRGVDPYRDVEHYMKGHGDYTFKRVLIEKATAAQQILGLVCEGHDVFLNLCDGASDEDRAGMEVVQLLEKYNQVFTGANSTFYEPSKELQKMMAHYYGVPTPPFIFAFDEDVIEEAHKWLKYPMIVKHYNGYGSVGMSKESKVANRQQLFDMARATIRQFRGALIEEFIEGREFTVLVAENPEDATKPITYAPVECVFLGGETFKHFDLKYRDLDNISWESCSDESLAEKLMEFAKKMFIALRGVGFGRADFRVNSDGQVYFLEMNPNCGVYYKAPDDNPNSLGSADFILLKEQHGHVKFTEHLITCAQKQPKKRTKPYEIRYKPETGYGMFARYDIKKGEVVNQHEGRPQFLVTKEYVENEWKDELMKKWFGEYAYPISDGIWATWSDDPLEWTQLNHSCDPNTWVKGLNLIARRDIPKGEHIAIDYATYCAENMADFECSCNAACCRKVIRGTDYQQPALMEKYKGHLSPYIQSRLKFQELKKSTAPVLNGEA